MKFFLTAIIIAINPLAHGGTQIPWAFVPESQKLANGEAIVRTLTPSEFSQLSINESGGLITLTFSDGKSITLTADDFRTNMELDISQLADPRQEFTSNEYFLFLEQLKQIGMLEKIKLNGDWEPYCYSFNEILPSSPDFENTKEVIQDRAFGFIKAFAEVSGVSTVSLKCQNQNLPDYLDSLYKKRIDGAKFPFEKQDLDAKYSLALKTLKLLVNQTSKNHVNYSPTGQTVVGTNRLQVELRSQVACSESLLAPHLRRAFPLFLRYPGQNWSYPIIDSGCLAQLTITHPTGKLSVKEKAYVGSLSDEEKILELIKDSKPL